jgi:hypothetical protein
MNSEGARRTGAFTWLTISLATLFVATYLIFQSPSELSSLDTKALSKTVENGHPGDPAGNLPRAIDKQGKLHSRQGLLAGYGNLPLSFEPNRGQGQGTTEFLSRGHGYSIVLNAWQATVVLRQSPVGPEHSVSRRHSSLAQGTEVAERTSSVSFTLLGTKDVGTSDPLDEIPGKSNYLLGNDPKKWITNVPHYARIRYKNVYQGIDLVYHGNQQQLESDFIVSPGAHPGIIRFAVDGSQQLHRSDNGDLILQTAAGQVRLCKPFAYQLINNVQTEVASSFRKISRSEFGFEIPAYDSTRTLIIDPVLTYSTLLGGGTGENGSDYGLSIAVDSAGSAYVTGSTVTTDFPTSNPLQSTNQGALDAFVTKLNPTGTGLVYSTYLGGAADEFGQGIAVDGGGNVYVTGFTVSKDFPTTPGAYSTTCTATDQAGIVRADVFITKLDPSGSALVYSTCLGGTADDEAYGIVVDAQGNAYIAGGTNSPDFPVTAGAFQTTFTGSASSTGLFADAFVTKINASGSALLYSTYLGGCGDDQANGIAVDSSGNAYITGETQSTTCLSANFPTTPGSFQSKSTEMGPFGDAFITKLNPSGSALVYSSFLGGYLEDSGNGIAIDAGGNAYVGGSTESINFPSTPGAFQSQNPDTLNSNGFVSKLSADGSTLVYSTFLGGEFQDSVSSIAVDSLDNSYVTGATYSGDFPFVDPFPQACVTTPTGEGKVFVTKLNQAGSALDYSVCVGGHGDTGNGIAMDGANNAYVIGTTFTDLVTTPGAFQSVRLGTTDAFIVKIAESSSLSATALGFGSQPLGIASTAQTTTLTYNGTSPLTIGTVSLSGTNVADFQIASDSCSGQVLASGSTCSVGVTFTPSAIGARAATAVIPDSSPESPLNVSLSGTGVDFSITSSPPSVTLNAGNQAAYSVTVTPQGGTFSNSVSLTCSLPATLTLSSCSLSPPNVNPGSNSATSTLTVKTAGPSASMVPWPGTTSTRQFVASALMVPTSMFAGIAFLGNLRRRRRAFSAMATVICWILLTYLVACGGGNGTPTQPGTPSGTYKITITGASGSLQHANTVTLVVQ